MPPGGSPAARSGPPAIKVTLALTIPEAVVKVVGAGKGISAMLLVWYIHDPATPYEAVSGVTGV
jgi:hypothetical protein